MSNNATATWIIAIIVVVIVVALGWWYFAQTSMVTTAPQNTTQSSEKSITAFVFAGFVPGVNGTIDNTNDTVMLTVPNGTDVTNLVPTIAVSDNATISPASGVAQDFTSPVTYTVTAQDGSTQNYIVTVAKAAQ